MSPNAANEVVSVTINGQTVQAAKGRIVIDVAEEMGIFVPRFCYHPGMKSVAVCRMCLVQVEGSRKLLPACATPVAPDMKVNTVDPDAVDAQKGMLEFLLINHPLDCPICDRAGECPLQDQTYAHGPGSSRYVEPKRSWEKPLEISDLVVLDRERCVLCWRCVRFADEIAGDQFIQLVDRGAGTQILTFKDEPFDSYFSGNTIQICPVGALLSKPYRFVSRPWNLKTAPSVCAYCSVGCPLTNETRSEKLVRCQALPNENVNDFWVCDKGRFAHHYVNSEERLTTPLVRDSEDNFDPVMWGRALEVIGEKLKDKSNVGVIAGGHLTTEDAYAIGRLAKKVIGTPHVDSRIQDTGAPYELAIAATGAAGSSATLNDVEAARTIVWAGPDPKETLPVLYLRLRKAVLGTGAKLIVVSPRRISLDAFATRVVRTEAGAEADAVASLPIADGTAALGEGLVLCWGPSAAGRDDSALLGALTDLATQHNAKMLICPPHAGSQGMIDMGVYPTLDAGYAPVKEAAGKDTRAILEAAAAGELDALLIIGADPIADFPDAGLAHRALEKGVFTVVVELFPTETVARADVVLPSATYAEREATFTNMERRLQKLEPATAPPGTATEPWRACQAIARALGDDWGWSSFDDVWADIKRNVPTHADVDVDALAQETPPPTIDYESPFQTHTGGHSLAGPGGQYPKGHRSGAPFQTGQNWPLSWELRAFEAKQRPGYIPPANGVARSGKATGDEDGAASARRLAEEAAASAAASVAERAGSSDVRQYPAEGGVPNVTAEGGSAPPAAAGTSETAEQGGQARNFALYSGRLIYDEGAMVSRSVALRNIAQRPFVELNEDDAKELELSEGDEALVSADGFEARVEVRLGDIVRGAVFVPYDQRGLAANRLISGTDPRVQVSRPQT